MTNTGNNSRTRETIIVDASIIMLSLPMITKTVHGQIPACRHLPKTVYKTMKVDHCIKIPFLVQF